MREKLDDLRIDLGIPDDDEDASGTGLNSTLSHSRVSRRTKNTYQHQQLHGTATIQKKTLPNLHSYQGSHSHLNGSKGSPKSRRSGRSPSSEGKPPLPLHGGKGSSTMGSTLGMSQDLNATDGSRGQEVDDGDSVFATVTRNVTLEGSSADVLKVEHDDLENNNIEDTLQHPDDEDDIDENEAQTMLYRKQLASLDRSGSDVSGETGADGTLRGDGYTDRTEEQGII